MTTHLRNRRRPNRRRSLGARVESLEDRRLLSATWGSFAANPQHTALSSAPSQSLDRIAWQTPVNLNPQYSGGDLLIHYGSPLATAANTVIVPVKTGASGGFELRAFSGSDGAAEWTLPTDYILPPHDWTPSYSPVLTPAGRLYFAGAGGTVYYANSPDSPGATVSGHLAFYGINNYTHAGFDGSVYISTPLTSDANGDIFFGFQVTGSNPLDLKSGIARIGADGSGSWVAATTASGDSGLIEVPQNCAPALSADGKTLYIAVSSGDFGRGDLLALDSTTLATLGKVALIDPATGKTASITNDSTASPTVGPDGDVYYGVLENPFASNHDRGWLLHFSGDLTKTKIPGAFGWDDTASIVPASMVPSYTGTSSYLLMTKYNNYAAYGGGGRNQIAILDPNAMEDDPVTGASVMKEVETILGPTPDPQYDKTYPGAVREWCINTAAVDPATDSVLANSEDGILYRWDLANDTFSQKIVLTTGQGEAYTPTLIGADGTVYAINDAVLYAVQALTDPVHIVDDSGTGFTSSGSWTSGTSGYGGESQTAPAGTGTSTATWSFIVTPGTYRVSASWTTGTGRATNAPFGVYDGSRPVGSFAVDQQDAPSTFTADGAVWQDLGGPVTVTGNTLVVTLSNNANGVVDADAIRIERLAAGQPFAAGGDASVDPRQFRVTTFATGLNYPTGMVQLSDGSVLVATSRPNSGSSSYYNSTGQLVRLVNANGDGVADGAGTVLASGLPGSLTGLQQAGPYIVVTSSNPNATILFLHTGATPASPLTLAGSISLAFPSPWEHTSYGLAVRPTPGQPGSYDVLFNVGSQYNGITTDSGGHIIPQPTTGKVTASGLISGTLSGDSIYMVTLRDNNGTPALSDLRQVATGLRNAASLAFDPATGDLLLADNGMDGIPDPTEAYSADTLQRIAAANIGVVVPNFGFPTTYTLTTTTPGGTGTRVNPSGGVTPLAAFEPLVDPLLPATGSESEGASGFAPSPVNFPAGLNHGVFIGFHGQFSQGGTANEENPLLYADPSTGHYFDFVSNDLPNIGHFDGAMSTADSLFLSDITSGGNVFSQPGQGVIYQIKALPTASASVNLSSAYNREGIVADGSKFGGGGLDGDGYALSANLVGTSLTAGGAVFALGPAGAKDVVSAAGQAIALPPGNDAALKLLAAGVNGAQANQAFTVTYTDGTTATLVQSISDWAIPKGYAGEATALTTAYRDTAAGGQQAGAFRIYQYTFALDPAKMVQSLTLPDDANLEVLAAALVPAGTTQVDLSSAYNREGIVADGSKFGGGGLDGDGYALSANLVGTSLTAGGAVFALGPAGAKDVVSAAGQAIALPLGRDGALKLLAAGVNGAQPNQTFIVTYADGTTATFVQSISDWAVPQNYAGEVTALATAYRDTSGGGQQAGTFRLYEYTLALDPTKAVKSLTLPKNTNVEVLAAALIPAKTTRVALSSAFNRVGIVADGAPFGGGGLDGVGNALSSSLVGTSLTVRGDIFDLGASGAKDVVSAAGQTITLPSGKDGALKLLAAGVNGAQPNQTFIVTYADGTTATFVQSISDWAVPQGFAGESTALATAYRDTSGGTEQAGPFRIYEYALALDPTKAVKSLTLPNDANVEVLAIDVLP